MASEARINLEISSLTALAYQSTTQTAYCTFDREDKNYSGYVKVDGVVGGAGNVFVNWDMSMYSPTAGAAWQGLLNTPSKLTASGNERFVFTGASILPLMAYGRMQVRAENTGASTLTFEKVVAQFLVDK